ncbi:hypothetical protein ABBQ38_004894 [Trebouxia sp. C0009 RCD-2024]
MRAVLTHLDLPGSSLPCMSAKSAPGPSSVLRGHRADVQALCCHPDRALLYSGDSAGEAKAWDLTTERATWSQRLHPNEAGVTALHIAGPDCARLLSQGRDGTIKSWALSAEGLPSRTPLHLIETGSYNFCRMAVLSHDACVSEGCGANPPVDIKSGQAMSSNQDTDRQQAESVTDGMGATCSTELKLEHRNSATEGPAENARQGTSRELIVAIAGHDPAVLEIWNMQTGVLVQQLTQPAGHKHGMCMAVQLYTQSEQSVLYALVGYEDGTVAVWDVIAGRFVKSSQLHAEPVMAVAVADDGSGGICAAADNKVQCFGLGSPSTLLQVLATLEVKQHGIADICIRPDQRLFATAGWDGKLRLFHHKKMRPLAILQYHRKGVTALAFQPHNQRLISASRDGTIAIWSVFQRETT